MKFVGLSQEDKKYLEVERCSDLPFAGALYKQSKGFYAVFREVFKEGFSLVCTADGEQFKVPNLENLGPCLTNYHFSIETMLKAIIFLKTEVSAVKKTHNLITLLDEAMSFFPSLSAAIKDNPSYKLLLKELSIHFDAIRYAEGTIFLSHNKRKGWERKFPLQELSEIMDQIFNILKTCFEENR